MCCTSAPTSRAGSPAYELPEGAHPSPCLGLCERAPAALRTIAGEEPREIQIPETGPPLPQQGQAGPAAPAAHRGRRRSGVARRLPRGTAATPRCGARSSSARTSVLREVKESRLLGRGGAAFPTGAKWEAVAGQPAQPHYLVCNADESEPGTFKDRVLMEGDPFALVEAMTIAAYATGCEHGFVYVRAEYPLAHARLENAFAQARAHGLLGDDVMGSGFAFDIELRIGAGAYVCGEETALFQSIEGYRGEPRNKPPFPVEVGLFGKPTVANNVETLFNVLEVLSESGIAYAETGTEDSTGTRLFCLSGHVGRPGLYEVPFGTTLRELLELAEARPAEGRAARRRRRARSCGPTSSTCRSRSRTRARPARRSAPAS